MAAPPLSRSVMCRTVGTVTSAQLPEPLIGDILALNSQLDLPHVFDRFLTAATAHTGAKYAAINIVNEEGIRVDFHVTGMPDGVWAHIGRAPNHVATLAKIPDDGIIVIDEL